jgi:hypothetical protein
MVRLHSYCSTSQTTAWKVSIVSLVQLNVTRDMRRRGDVKSKRKVKTRRNWVGHDSEKSGKKVPVKIDNISDKEFRILAENGDTELTVNQTARGIEAIYADAGYSREEALLLFSTTDGTYTIQRKQTQRAPGMFAVRMVNQNQNVG